MDPSFDCIDPNLLQLLDDDDESVPLHSNCREKESIDTNHQEESCIIQDIVENSKRTSNIEAAWRYSGALEEAPVITVSSDVAPPFTIPITEHTFVHATSFVTDSEECQASESGDKNIQVLECVLENEILVEKRKRKEDIEVGRLKKRKLSLDNADSETVSAVDSMIYLGDVSRFKEGDSKSEDIPEASLSDSDLNKETLAEYASRIKQKETTICNSLEEAILKIKDRERLQGVIFLRHKQPKNFGKSDWKKCASKRKVYWENNIPYIKAANDVSIYECHQGPDHDALRKEKRRLLKPTSEFPQKLQRNDIGRTKKIGCPARIVLDERIYFPWEKVVATQDQKLETLMRTCSARIKNKFSTLYNEEPDILGERRICLIFDTDHNHETQGNQNESIIIPENVSRDLDSNVIDYIYKLVWDGYGRPSDVKKLLLQWIWSELLPIRPNQIRDSPQLSGRILPGHKDVYNHMVVAKQFLQQFQNEQEEIKSILEAPSGDSQENLYYYQPYKRIVKGGRKSENCNKDPSNRFGQVAEDISACPWKKLSQLQEEGTVVLLSNSHAVLAFGKKMPSFDNMPPNSNVQWFSVTEVVSIGAVGPLDGVILSPGAFTKWPMDKVLDVKIETVHDSDMEIIEERETTKDSQDSPLLIVYQTFKTKEILKKFGGTIVFLDLVCQANRSNFNLHTMTVRTKTCFEVVAFLITDTSKDSNLLKSALTKIKEWNEDWSPRFIMTKGDDIQISAVEETFVGCTALIEEDAMSFRWLQWLSSSRNGCTDVKDDVLQLLRSVESSETKEVYEERILELNTFLEDKKRPNLTSYIRNVWLSQSKRWVTAFCCIKFMGKCRPKLRLVNEKIEFSLDKESVITKKYHSLIDIIKNVIYILKTSAEKYDENNSTTNIDVTEFKHVVDQFNQLTTVMTTIPNENILNRSTKLLSEMLKDCLSQIKEVNQ